MSELMEREDAEMIGLAFINDVIGKFCSRAELAGSIRRGQSQVGDIEVVAQPWNEASRLALHAVLVRLENEGWVKLDRKSKDGRKAPFGPRYYRLTYGVSPLDLFLVIPPAEWGIIFTIRTGPAGFSHWLVTEALKRGFKVEDGQLFQTHKDGVLLQSRSQILCPEEKDFFKALGVTPLLPEFRK